MSFASQATQQKFPFKFDQVFDGLLRIIPQSGMILKSQDKVIGRITASAGMSVFSWGENLTIMVEKLDESSTLVGIESSLKLGANFAGAHRHQKNFDNIVHNLSEYLQGRGEPQAISQPLIIDRPKFNRRKQIVMLLFTLLLLFAAVVVALHTF